MSPRQRQARAILRLVDRTKRRLMRMLRDVGHSAASARRIAERSVLSRREREYISEVAEGWIR